MAVVKAQSLYKQVAREMRKSIARGQWTPGDRIPTEDKLTALYGVSRPTVRQAVAELRSEGLLDVQQGRGTYVRGPNPDAVAPVYVERTVTRTGKRYNAPDGWSMEEPATVYRVRLEATAAEILHAEEGEAAFLVDRMIIHEASGTRARHAVLLPMEQITGTSLAQQPDVSPTDAYGMLAAAHGPIEWREAISARMPNPDERATLHVAEGVPVLVSQAVTQTQADHRRLMLETTTMEAGATHLTYTHRPTTAKRPATA
ncbi:GntR family transcriptional regulator [Kitasatospora sp. MAA4]|uniref:GntR family transcriptional regulator n=1 Tax=Kitasatospora sp. MAA4 TaxID=3035093 RepID=UPI002475D206|nr:GntR family transcriptional regulator [Kitasatospora sp. MAA4]MDH6135037.1 GntR family transcriptional regulator [Kitasatospora sp. MAA4]